MGLLRYLGPMDLDGDRPRQSPTGQELPGGVAVCSTNSVQRLRPARPAGATVLCLQVAVPPGTNANHTHLLRQRSGAVGPSVASSAIMVGDEPISAPNSPVLNS